MDYSSENRYRDFDRQFGNSKSYTNSNNSQHEDEENDSSDFFDSTLGTLGSPKASSRNYSANTFNGEMIDNYNIDDEEEAEEIVTPVKRKPRKTAPAKVKYLGWFDWKGLSRGEIISRLSWILCFGMILRLIMMDQGVIDFVKMENRLSARENILKEIHSENKDIMNEIDLIKNNPSYQKKLVRDHLGAISSDEFLILFPNDIQAVPN